MKNLKEMAGLVGKNKTKQIQIIGNSQNREGKVFDFYEGILNNRFSTDAEACLDLFGTEEIHQNYRNLKANLERRLINTLFFTEGNAASFTKYQTAYYNCYRNLCAVKIMIGKYARNAAMKLAEKTLKQSLRYQFNDISIILLRDLRNYYGTIVGDRKKFNEYHEELKKQELFFAQESRVREMYDILASNFSTSNATQPKLVERAKIYYDELNCYLEHNPTLSFNFLAYLVIALCYEIENNKIKTVTTCDEALKKIRENGFVSNTQQFTFLFKKLNSLIQLKRYEEGEIVAKECLELMPEGSLNWSLTYQAYFILLFHAKKFQEAYRLSIEVNPFKKSKNIPNIVKEHWSIVNAYLNYFISLGMVELPVEAKAKKFRLGKFYNDVPKFSKDKRGMNISVLIIQLLIWLREKNYDKVINRTEALQAYSSRYLRRNDTYRSNCFIKMLMQIPEVDFGRIALERRADTYFEKLKSMPLEIANQQNEVEIVPYEFLWELVLESLQDSSPIRRKRKPSTAS